MTKKQRFEEYKKLRATFNTKTSSRMVKISESLGSLYNSHNTWAIYQRYNREKSIRAEVLRKQKYSVSNKWKNPKPSKVYKSKKMSTKLLENEQLSNRLDGINKLEAQYANQRKQLDAAYDDFARKQDKKSLKGVEKLLPKSTWARPKKSVKVSWMKRVLNSWRGV